MSEVKSYKHFCFRTIEYQKPQITDCTRVPCPMYYFGCLIQGTAEIKTKNNRLELHPGEVFYLPKGLHYRSYWYPDENKKCALFSFGFSFMPLEQSFSLQKVNCSDFAKSIFDRLRQEIPMTNKGPGLLYSFLGETADSLALDQDADTIPIIKTAIAFLQHHPNSNIRELSAFCGISESGLYNAFKSHLGRTPNHVRQEILCEKAIELLTSTTLSVDEISCRLNFSSSSYFRKVLRQHTGKTPTQIRQEAERI